ncbi:MAG: DUF1592 domain-containing protein [Armatimonadetes bacterium]|nr:DUF1592 domain-containing protein [Armatimonadota bacterium]
MRRSLRMGRTWISTCGWVLGLGTLALGVFASPKLPKQAQPLQLTDDQKKLEAEYKKSIKPLIDEYCATCHVGEQAPGKLDFDSYKGLAAILDNQKKWDQVVLNVRSEVMPPPGMPVPSKADRDKLVDFIQRAFSSNCNLENVGRVTIRRLNRTEYRYTVQDLLGLDLDVTRDFPSDNVGYGYDNIGDVLTLSPLHMEKYMKAAEDLSKAAIQITTPKNMVAEFHKATLPENARLGNSEEIFFFANGRVNFNFPVEEAGDYMLTIVAAGTPAGPDLPELTYWLDGVQQAPMKVPAVPAKPGTYRVPLTLRGKPTQIGVGFLNDYYAPNDPNPNNRDRNLIIYSMRLDGPDRSTIQPSESHRRIIYGRIANGTEMMMGGQFLRRFMTRAYRRPATEEELSRLMVLFKKVLDSGDPFERAMQVCVQAVLVNPNFLFRVELDDVARNGASRQLNDFELANRLSYFLWSSMPDDELMQLATTKTLSQPDILDKQIARMMADPKAARFAENFATQWLQIKRIEVSSPDPELFPGFDSALQDSMIDEAVSFFGDAVRNNRSISEFITSDYTFLNSRLARHYGIPNVSWNEMRRFNVKEYNRGGLLGMGAVLTVTSNPNRTSPVKRGKWVMEQVLGTPPPPPPPNVGVLADDKATITTKNMRERLEMHRKDPSCAACHKPLDAIGFTLENFDAVGKWRDKDGVFEVDNKGEMPDGTKLDGVTGLRRLLIDREDDFVRNLCEQMMIYALGRGMNASDKCQIDLLVERVQKKGGRMQDLISEIVNSDLFQKRSLTEETSK